MKAAVFEATKKPLVVKNVPDPECAPNSAIVKVEANGICRSDWHACSHRDSCGESSAWETH
jgi:D-arabinose 1-dehydrogenase-like Zn-dependent alcohol dehydrogenase